MHKENIVSAYTFEENRLKFAVTEPLDVDLAELGAKTLGDLVCEILGARA